MAYKIELTPSGNVFEAAEGEIVLNAALDAGVQLPYSCRRGTCSTCRGRIVSGSVDYGDYQEAMLPPEMKAKGYALLCQATPLSDLKIEAQELKLQAQPPRIVPCRVRSLNRITADVAILTLRLPQNEQFKFAPGQFVDILLKDGKRRSYSMANPPSVHGVIDIELHVRHTPGGLFTDHVFTEMAERELLRFEGPFGTFVLREDSEKPIIFVASGTGFAPIKAIIQYALENGNTRPMALYWGGNVPGDIYMRELAESWAARHAHFQFVPVISAPAAADAWSGRAGFVHHAVMQDFPDLSGHQVYACGNPLMVDAARHDFVKLSGLLEEEFFADPFVTELDINRESAA